MRDGLEAPAACWRALVSPLALDRVISLYFPLSALSRRTIQNFLHPHFSYCL